MNGSSSLDVYLVDGESNLSVHALRRRFAVDR